MQDGRAGRRERMTKNKSVLTDFADWLAVYAAIIGLIGVVIGGAIVAVAALMLC